MAINNIHHYIRPGCHAHLVGVGGVSMAPLAEVLHGIGMTITGSDMHESKTVEHLRSLGISVTIGHWPESVAGADVVIRTAAVHDENPEIKAARDAGIPVFERAQAWGSIMRGYQNAVCIAGTHGKTTTSSMSTCIAMAAQVDPTVMIGGTLPVLGANHRVGKGDTIILESCEYCNSFLSFFPTVAVILNVEADHLDFFHDLEDIEHSFRTFAELTPKDGLVIANCEDENTMHALEGLDRPLLTFGLERGDVRAEGLTFQKGMAEFDVVAEGKLYTHVALQVPGVHNVKNALAAAAAAYALHIPGEAVAQGLGAFKGAGRRFEHKGSINGAEIYDDYAHHPAELKALLDTAKTLGYQRVVCAFQPHTYTRTKALFHDFTEVLRQPDLTLLAEIFAAREDNTSGISSKDLAEQIPGSLYFPTLEELTAYLRENARPGDLILTVGAGDIYTVGNALAQQASTV